KIAKLNVRVRLALLSRQAFDGQFVEIGLPALILLLAEQVEVAPGIQPGAMTIIEGNPRGVVSDALEITDAYVLLARHRYALIRRVAANFSRRAHDAQHFGG